MTKYSQTIKNNSFLELCSNNSTVNESEGINYSIKLNETKNNKGISRVQSLNSNLNIEEWQNSNYSTNKSSQHPILTITAQQIYKQYEKTIMEQQKLQSQQYYQSYFINSQSQNGVETGTINNNNIDELQTQILQKDNQILIEGGELQYQQGQNIRTQKILYCFDKNIFITSLNLIKCGMESSILFLPLIFVHLGLIQTILLLIISGFLCYSSWGLMLKVLNGQENANMTLTQVMGKLYGKVMERFCDFMTVAYNFFTLVAFTGCISDLQRPFLHKYTGLYQTEYISIFLILIVYLMTIQIKSIEKLSPFSAFGILMTLIVFLVIIKLSCDQIFIYVFDTDFMKKNLSVTQFFSHFGQLIQYNIKSIDWTNICLVFGFCLEKRILKNNLPDLYNNQQFMVSFHTKQGLNGLQYQFFSSYQKGQEFYYELNGDYAKVIMDKNAQIINQSGMNLYRLQCIGLYFYQHLEKQKFMNEQ
ncbi:hypothetical protein PPERSA_02999 [Pseudocohnilembus persalinus]|uniref:Amino acid transporter transmembrane domain-containing protein n=1 Tax=Pseudocohnilembus persalinus TaxID=266149 RepID=A0A0V0QEZ8_PSEPJ|nr:hypothetical protein PPERSA_02999 [Pseudocohnilembus persalinus]|eukprot:KRX00739.1 hypothetical protein PPERSA_02999 [Pseudocohnilembus persalinus]